MEKPGYRYIELGAVLQEECKKRGWIDPQDIVFIAENYTRRTKKLQLRQDITEGISFCLPLLNEEGEPTEKQRSTALLRLPGWLLQRCRSYRAVAAENEKIAQRETVEKEVNRILSEHHGGMLINTALGNAMATLTFSSTIPLR